MTCSPAITMADCIHGIEEAWCGNCRPRPERWGPKRWADMLFAFIPSPGEDPLSQAELAEQAGLTNTEVAGAVIFLRENYPEFPLVSSPKGYRFTMDGIDVAKFRLWRVRTAQTAMRRAWRGVMLPYLTQTADAAEIRRVTRQFDRLLEDISDLTT